LLFWSFYLSLDLDLGLDLDLNLDLLLSLDLDLGLDLDLNHLSLITYHLSLYFLSFMSRKKSLDGDRLSKHL